MTTPMSNEIYWLLLTILMTSLFWMPYIINRIAEQGIFNALWDPFGDTHTEKAWARRMMDAHANAVENLVVFAPLVLLIEMTGMNSIMTTTACTVYFFTRLTHFFVFTFAVPLLRVVTFLIGFGMQATLALTLLDIV